MPVNSWISLEKQASVVKAHMIACVRRLCAGARSVRASAGRQLDPLKARTIENATGLLRRSATAHAAMRNHLQQLRSATQWLRAEIDKRQPSSLVHHILSVQLVITGAIGAFALAGLSWTSQAITDENLSRWAAQWTSQLNELGAPLYVSDPGSAIVDVEHFVATYPEVAYVDWYGPNGQPIFSVAQDGYDAEEPQALDAATVAVLKAGAGTDTPRLVHRDDDRSGRYQLLGPIWSESIVGDGLIDFDVHDAPETTLEVLGFVGVELDYGWYEGELAWRLAVGSLFLALILALSWAFGRRVLKKALSPLSHLQRPLAELADGNMEVEFAPSRHDEIQNIIRTLEGTASALAQRDRRLSHLATHDSLTSLLNRHAFVQELANEIERLADSGEQSAVLFIDLDQFKYINDTCGHPAGDELLRIAARSIRANTRGEDIVARFGGDEFAVLARGVTREQARRVGEKIIEQMGMLTQVWEDKVFHLQCSIGITMVRYSELGPHEFLSQADIACHAAKEKGRNRLEIYKVSKKEAQQMAKEVDWVQKVRQALETDSFVLVFQPLLRLSTGWTDHYEVLLRLQGEDGALIGPDAFLPAAARFGLMVDIDYWVLENAIRALAAHRTPRTTLNFSINLSAHVFESERLAKRVEALLKEHDVDPEAIIFEITEQIAVRFAAESDKQIGMIRDIGCRFAIDDFGKGYSSFSYLKQLPVNYLKIDGSFIENLEHDEMDQTLVKAMGEIARAARIETIAECVHNAATLELLVELGIDYAQGFFIAHPDRAPTEIEMPVRRKAGRARRVAGNA